MRDAPDSIAPVEVPDRDHIRGVARFAARMGEYLAARARGENGRRSSADAVRFIPHTPEQRAEFIARTHQRPAPEEKRPQAYTYKRSAALAYQRKKVYPPNAGAPCNATPNAPVPASGEGKAVVAPRPGLAHRNGSIRRKAASRKSLRQEGAPSISTRPKRRAMKRRKPATQADRLAPDFSNLGEVIRRQLGLA